MTKDRATLAILMMGLERECEDLAQPSDSVEQEPVAKYIGECNDGSLVQLYDDVKKGTTFYTSPQKRTHLTDEQAHQTLLKMAKHVETFGNESTAEQALSAECIRFILEQVDVHSIKETI